MSELRIRLADDLKTAMRSRDQIRLSTIRLLIAALKNAEIAVMHPLTDAEVEATLVAQIKQRRDSIEQFRQAGREDLATKEEAELAVLSAYLPPPPTDEEVTAAVHDAVRATGASSPKDMAAVMRVVLDRYPGRVDGKQLSLIVRQALGAKA